MSHRIIRQNGWRDCDDPRIPRWPSEYDERGIEVSITNWIGHGGRHYSVRVKEEEQQYWSETQNAWIHVSIDSQNRGIAFEAEVLEKNDGQKFAQLFIDYIKAKSPQQKFRISGGFGEFCDDEDDADLQEFLEEIE